MSTIEWNVELNEEKGYELKLYDRNRIVFKKKWAPAIEDIALFPKEWSAKEEATNYITQAKTYAYENRRYKRKTAQNPSAVFYKKKASPINQAIIKTISCGMVSIRES